MLDTLKVCLNDFEIRKGASLTIQPSPINYSTGELISDFPLWERQEGGEERGSKAYLNTKHFNMEVVPMPGGTRAFLHFSIPKIHNGENFYSVGKEGTETVIKQVQGELAEAGIKTNLQEANLSRIDTFQNIITEEPFTTYSPVFSLLQASRKLRRDYGTTFLWSNSQQELCVYDKIEEMSHRKIETASYPAQTMRFEFRLLNKKKIETALGFSQVKDISANWGGVKENFKEAWEKNIFSMEVGEIEVMASEQVFNEMKYFYEKYGRDYLDYYIKLYGGYLIAQHVGVEPIRLAIKRLEEGKDRETIKKKVQRATKRLEEAKKEVELIRGIGEGRSKSLSTLYNELRKKVCLN